MSKTILIAGCEGKVGKAVSKLFKASGWKVIGFDIKDECDGKILDKYIKVDIKDAIAVDKAVETIKASDNINALFNTAGYTITKGFEETSAEEWDGLLNTILGGAANLCKSVAPIMAENKEGKIILLSSDYSREKDDHILNAAAAHTLHGFGKSFGVEMASANVLVNILFANTPFDLDQIASTVLFLADKDTYTSAQVVSITGKEQ